MAFIPLNILNIADTEPAHDTSELSKKNSTEKRKYNIPYGTLKAAAIPGAAVMVRARMYGIMRRLFLTYSLHWRGVCGIQNFVRTRTKTGTKLQGQSADISEYA
jgi:hypothetical protein